jgi:hypothetical protein
MTWKALYFNVNSTDEFAKFKRRILKPKDCVINALQVLGLIEERSAEIMRIMVGDSGISANQIEEIFEFTYPNQKFKFKEQSVLNLWNILDLMPYDNPSVVFAGVEYKGGGGHVFIIERSAMGGHFKILDPHVSNNPIQCGDETNDVIKKIQTGVERFYILSGQ